MDIDREGGAPAPPPESGRLRDYLAAWGGLALLALLFAGLVFEAHREQPDGPDQRALEWVVRHREEYPAVTALARAVTRLGDDVVAYPLVIALAAGLYALGRWRARAVWRREWGFFLGVMIVGTLSGSIIKRLVGRPRPEEALRLVHETTASFPSGHSVYGAVLGGLVALIVGRAIRGVPGWARWGVAVVCALFMAAIAASRVWLAAHYPTDVLGGICLGLAWVGLAWRIRGRRATPRLSRGGPGGVI
jgi:undecaprenyl-diphosphatase